MIGYAHRHVFSDVEQALLIRATRLVDRAPFVEPGGKPGDWVRCHELARAMGLVLGLEVCDGRFGYVEHSWLWTTPLDRERDWHLPNVLDVYVVGALPQVQLVNLAPSLCARYLPGPSRDDVRADVVRGLTRLFAATLRAWPRHARPA